MTTGLPDEVSATCACGERRNPTRAGCDSCERETLLELHAARPAVILPRHWWRRFEPEWSCGAYYLFGRADREGTTLRSYEMKLAELEIVTACPLGVSIETMDVDLSHFTPEEARSLGNVLLIAAADQAFIASATERLEEHIAARIARWRRA